MKKKFPMLVVFDEEDVTNEEISKIAELLEANGAEGPSSSGQGCHNCEQSQTQGKVGRRRSFECRTVIIRKIKQGDHQNVTVDGRARNISKRLKRKRTSSECLKDVLKKSRQSESDSLSSHASSTESENTSCSDSETSSGGRDDSRNFSNFLACNNASSINDVASPYSASDETDESITQYESEKETKIEETKRNDNSQQEGLLNNYNVFVGCHEVNITQPSNAALPDLSSKSKLDAEATSNSINFPDHMYVSIDCEMVGIGPKGRNSALARCSILDYDGNVLYDEYIRPVETITDYRTPWSGIRPYHMYGAKSVESALTVIRTILEDKIIIGHAVYNDFNILGFKPKPYFIRDTAQCIRLVRLAQLEGQGNSLKKLAAALLHRDIQDKKRGHCSVEDARATLDLFKLVREDFEQDLLAKWRKRDSNVLTKLKQGLMTQAALTAHHQPEDFLHDRFWPDAIHN